MEPIPIAFYAPMKAPDHPAPSGDRAIARLTLAALEHAGFAPRLVSELRLFDRDGDPARQRALQADAVAEAYRIEAALAAAPPRLWFTYHCYHKAPDLLGPRIARALDIPYVISEPSISPRQRDGPWASFAGASEAALGCADLLLWTTGRDRPGLEHAGFGDKMVHLPAFAAAGPAPVPRDAGDPLRLLTVAMMRAGDKLDSYRRLAAGLMRLSGAWRLDVIGDGDVRAEVRQAFAPLGARVTFQGAVADPSALQGLYARSDLFCWPGVGEGVGMVYLEAQAAGLPVVAEDHSAQRDLIANALAPPDDPGAFAALIRESAANRRALSNDARARIEARHTLEAAADVLSATLGRVLA